MLPAIHPPPHPPRSTAKQKLAREIEQLGYPSLLQLFAVRVDVDEDGEVDVAVIPLGLRSWLVRA
jgi:hypothetical protein